MKTKFNNLYFFIDKLNNDIEAFILDVLKQNNGEIKFIPAEEVDLSNDLNDYFPVVATLNGDDENFNIAIDRVYLGEKGGIYASGYDNADGCYREDFYINAGQHHEILIYIGITLGLIIREFRKDQPVYWLDPDGINSGLYKIMDANSAKNRLFEKEQLQQNDIRTFWISKNGTSEIEVYGNEIYFLTDEMIRLLCPGQCKIEVTAILGTASGRFQDTGKVPSGRWISKHGGEVHKKYFNSEGELNAYREGLSDMCGYEDWTVIPQIIAQTERPDCSFCEHWRSFFSDKEKSVYCPDCGKKIMD